MKVTFRREDGSEFTLDGFEYRKHNTCSPEDFFAARFIGTAKPPIKLVNSAGKVFRVVSPLRIVRNGNQLRESTG